MPKESWEHLLDANSLSRTINCYLKAEYNRGQISRELYLSAREKVLKNINTWLAEKNIERIVPNFRLGLARALQERRIDHVIYAFIGDITFGTAGIRGIVTFTEKELNEFARKGPKAAILRGPNTINEAVLLLKSAGVARYAEEKKLARIVIGYDSRLQGRAFAELIARLFLARNLSVYLFDRVCSYPEVAFAVPHLKADIGILISASHNDKRYNGYKLLSRTGAQFNVLERNYVYEKFIKHASLAEIALPKLTPSMRKKLFHINILAPLVNHIKKFVLDEKMVRAWAPQIRIGYSAYYGAGRNSVPQILKEFGFKKLHLVHSLYQPDGRFPCFALEQQPDPGDPVAAEIAVTEYIKEYGRKSFDQLDLLIGTDPDADRMGIVVKVPAEQQAAYRKILKRPDYLKLPETGRATNTDGTWLLLDADSAWTLLLWYRLEKERGLGRLGDADKKFIVLNNNTSDSLVYLAKKYGLGAVKTWVGFAMISDSISQAWAGKTISHQAFPNTVYQAIDMAGRKINVGAFEQSSGFSILGGPPKPGQFLGENGHIRDKDGTLAAILLAEVAAYAKSLNKSLIELLDEKIYLDPEIGLFITYYEPEPYWGQYEGLTGISRKVKVLRTIDALRENFLRGQSVSFGGQKVTKVETYQTGKYDQLHEWPGFPDEGIRFFFDRRRLCHLTVRPSGTSQCLRLHIQIKMEDVTRENLLARKIEGYDTCKRIMHDLRRQAGLL